MPVTNVTSKWVSGNLIFTDNDGNQLLGIKTDGVEVTSRVQELTVSGAISPGVESIELNHATVAVVTTIADLSNHQGLLMIKDTSATGTAAHTVTATVGTFDGTNNVLTLNALNEAIAIYVDSAGNGTILENVGSVAIS